MASVASASTARIPSSIRRDLLLCGLNKLEDRDTLKTAVDELNVIIQGLDAQGVSALVSCLCRVERGQKNFARKECLRLFVSMASCTCPSRDVFLSPSIISKTTRFLIQSFQDSDAGVRETASKTFAMIAREWSLFHKQLIRGEESNIFMKRVFKALADPKREVQIAASDALNEMSAWVGSFQKELAKDLLRFLKSPDFVAKASLLQALGSIDAESSQPKGMIAANVPTFRSLIFPLIGREESMHHSGQGLIHFLSSSDWFSRRAAVDCLRCMALLFAPELVNSKKKIIPKIKEKLRRQRFDRVKPVRDIIQKTLDIYESLSDSASVLQNNDLQLDAPNDAESGHQHDDLTETEVDAISILNDEPKDNEDNTFTYDDASDGTSIAHSISCTPKAKVAAREGGKKGHQDSRSRIHGGRYVERLKSSVKKKSRGTRRTSPKNPETSHTSHNIQDTARSVEVDPGAQPFIVHGNEERQFQDIASNISNKIQELSHCIHEEVSEIKQSLHDLQTRVANSEIQSHSPAMLDRQHTSIVKDVSSVMMEMDLDDLYASALPYQLKLLRLMQRTAPVIPQLSLSTLESLLETFAALIEQRRSLARILPWLWQLTEPSCHHIAASLSPDLHKTILRVLSDLQADDREESAQIESLESALAKTFLPEEFEHQEFDSPTEKPYEPEGLDVNYLMSS